MEDAVDVDGYGGISVELVGHDDEVGAGVWRSATSHARAASPRALGSCSREPPPPTRTRRRRRGGLPGSAEGGDGGEETVHVDVEDESLATGRWWRERGRRGDPPRNSCSDASRCRCSATASLKEGAHETLGVVVRCFISSSSAARGLRDARRRRPRRTRSSRTTRPRPRASRHGPGAPPTHRAITPSATPRAAATRAASPPSPLAVERRASVDSNFARETPTPRALHCRNPGRRHRRISQQNTRCRRSRVPSEAAATRRRRKRVSRSNATRRATRHSRDQLLCTRNRTRPARRLSRAHPRRR